ncbi:MAG TPA: DUF5110 domain-containing protein [Bacteroidales bacterium]|nr:DUF5110 domain-containing protein [Bacteroidales bacterium]
MLIYPADESSYTLYEDDGVSYEYEKGVFSLTKFTCRNSTSKRPTVEISSLR